MKARRIQNGYPLPDFRGKDTLVLYFTPGEVEMTGGVMSIFNMCRVTRGILPNAECLVVTSPGAATYAINSHFPNEERVYRLSRSILQSVAKFRVVYIHIPEYQVPLFNRSFDGALAKVISDVPELHINVMNQNLELMPNPQEVAKLKRFTPHVTQTTAHEVYTNQEVTDHYGIPLHRFGTHTPASRFAPFLKEPKRKLILYSPDENPNREDILEVLRKGMPEYELRMVTGLKYKEWLKLAASSFATITFGEGMDGFYADALCVKSLGIAVYNDTFFPSAEWSGLRSVYPSYGNMGQELVADLRKYEADPAMYEEVRMESIQKLKAIGLSAEQYADNLRRFYQGKFDFMPKA